MAPKLSIFVKFGLLLTMPYNILKAQKEILRKEHKNAIYQKKLLTGKRVCAITSNLDLTQAKEYAKKHKVSINDLIMALLSYTIK